MMNDIVEYMIVHVASNGKWPLIIYAPRVHINDVLPNKVIMDTFDSIEVS